jgi:hypothetical protein
MTIINFKLTPETHLNAILIFSFASQKIPVCELQNSTKSFDIEVGDILVTILL